MNIFRPDHNGIYRCINDPGNKSRYVLVEHRECLPTLIPLHGQYPYGTAPVLQQNTFVPLVADPNA